MALEESIDKLTASIDKLIEMGGVASAKPATTSAKPATPKASAKPKNKYSPDEVKAKFAELRANDKIGSPPLKKIITDAGHEDLAALLLATDCHDEAFAQLEAVEASLAADDDL